VVGADPRSIEPQGVAAAEWTRRWLGPGNRVVADRTNRLLLGSYGAQWPVSAFVDHVPVSDLFFAEDLGQDQLDTLRRGQIRYVLVDRRLGSGLPGVGVYIEFGETNAFHHTVPVSRTALTKFDDEPLASRIYDSGDITIYDVGALVNGS
jgi:hypothetical protein